MAGQSPVKGACPPPEYATARTSVWWDVEGCPVPEGCDPNAAACNIGAALERAGYLGPLSIAAYGDVNKIPDPVVKAMSSTGIGLHHVPAGVKDGSDKKILVDMLIWAIDNQAPANYLLITGDSDFSSVLHQLRLRKYNTLLAQSEYLSEPLISAANCIWLWKSLVAGGPAFLPYEGGAGSESSLHDHFHPGHMMHRSRMQADIKQRMPTLSYQQTTSKREMKRHVQENRTGLSNFLFPSCKQHKKVMVPISHFPRKTKCNGPVVRMPHTSVEGSNKRHKCLTFLKKENKNRWGGEKKIQKCKENNKCISKKQRKRKQNDPNYEEAYYNFRRQKKKDTDQNKDQAKLMQEIDLKKNNKETLTDELVQNKDISEQLRNVIEQNDVKQNDGASCMQDVIQYVNGFEKKNEMKRKRTELGQVEDGMEYDDNSKRAHFGMKRMDGSLHVEDEIYKAEQVENVQECMDGLKKAVNVRLYKNETVNYELEFKDGLEETQDKMKANKNDEIVKGNELDMDDRIDQIHVERARNEVQISGKVKEVVTVQKNIMNVRTVVKMDAMRQMNEMGHNLYNHHGGRPGYYWAVQNTPQCAICKLQHFGLCPWARVPCISCGTFGHFIDNCPLRLLQLFSPFFNYYYGS